MSQSYRYKGVGFSIAFNRTTPAAVLSHLCCCIQHFLTLCSRQTSFTLVNGIVISLNLPEVVTSLFWGKGRTWYWILENKWICYTLGIFIHNVYLNMSMYVKTHLSTFLNSNLIVISSKPHINSQHKSFHSALWAHTRSCPVTYTKEQPWLLEKLKSTEAGMWKHSWAQQLLLLQSIPLPLHTSLYPQSL